MSNGYLKNMKKNKSKLEWFKKNIVIVPVVAAIIAGTFTSVRYVLNLTDTITANQETIFKMESKITSSTADINDLKQRRSAAEAIWTMAQDSYRQLSHRIREHTYHLKDLRRQYTINRILSLRRNLHTTKE